MPEFRKVERLRADGTWEEIQFKELKKGDQFKLYDPNPYVVPVDNEGFIVGPDSGVGKGSENGEIVYTAEGDAYPLQDVPGNYAVIGH